MKKPTSRAAFFFIIPAALALIGLVSCANSAEITAPTVSPESTAPPLTSPNILGAEAYLVLDNGQPSGEINFSINESEFVIYPDWVGTNVFYMDVKPPFTPNQSALTPEGTYQIMNYDNFSTWKNTAPGTHTFWAQLVTTNTTPLNPPVDASIQIDMPAPDTAKPYIQSLLIQMLCRPGYVPPNQPGRPQGASACADINVSVNTKNFISISKIGQTNAAGQGHFIYYFNVTPPTASGKPALTEKGTYAITADSLADWLGVLPGEYQVWVQLVNNDNTPLDPPVIAGGRITVPIDADRY